MRLVRTVSVLALAALAFTACDDNPTEIEISAFAGFWNATQFEYSDNTGDAPGFGIDAIEDADGSVTLDVDADGGFSGTLDIPGLTSQALPIGGTISLVSQDVLHIDFNETTEGYGLFSDFDADFTLSGDVLTFVNDDTSFDFPDELEEAAVEGGARGTVDAVLTATFVR